MMNRCSHWHPNWNHWFQEPKLGGGKQQQKNKKKTRGPLALASSHLLLCRFPGPQEVPPRPPCSRPLINRKTKGLSRRCHIDIPPHQNNATMIIHIWSCLQSRLLVQEEMIRNFLAQPLNICLFCLFLEGFPKDLRWWWVLLWTFKRLYFIQSSLS